jgi:acyl-CoA-binding protein
VSDLQARFEAAVENSRTIARQPSNETLLKLYALYKQATDGDVQGDRPGFTDLRGRAKYDAWANLAGTPNDEAKASYAALVERLASE